MMETTDGLAGKLPTEEEWPYARRIRELEAIVRSEPFSDRALALGWLCHNWGLVEAYLDFFLQEMMQIGDDIGMAIASTLTAQRSVALARVVGFKKKIDDAWYTELTAVLDEIDTLRGTRNRYIHDMWRNWGGHCFVLEQRELVKGSPKSNDGPLQFRQISGGEVTAKEIWDLVDKARVVYIKIAWMRSQYPELRAASVAPKAPDGC